MAAEILVVHAGDPGAIRDDKVHQIYSSMQSGKKYGMQTLNDALYQLYMAREVALEECLRVSRDPNEFLRMIGEPAAPPTRTTNDAAGSEPTKAGVIWRARSASATGRRGHDAHAYLDVHRAHARTASSRPRLDRRCRTATRSVAQLRQQRLTVVKVDEEPKARSACGGGITMRDIVIFTRQFSTMINSGLPLVQALDILAQAEREQGAAGRDARRWCSTWSRATRWPTRCASTRRRSPSCT